MDKAKQLIGVFEDAQLLLEQGFEDYLEQGNNYNSLFMVCEGRVAELYDEWVASPLSEVMAVRDKLFTFIKTGQVRKSVTVAANDEKQALGLIEAEKPLDTRTHMDFWTDYQLQSYTEDGKIYEATDTGFKRVC